MKIAVTGASGFIGRHVLRELISRRNHEIVVITRRSGCDSQMVDGVRYVHMDIASAPPDGYERLGRPDTLLHLAWAGLPNYLSLHHFESELPSQYAFLRSLVQAGLPSMTVTGTCYEYGMRCGALEESQVSLPANPYAYAKDCLRRQLEFLKDKFAFSLVWARLFFMYGEGQPSTSLYGQLVDAIKERASVFPMSAGEQLRDYMRVEDVARMLVELASRRLDCGPVNVCSGKPTSVRRLVEDLIGRNRWNIRIELGHYPYPAHEPMAFWGGNAKFERLIVESNEKGSPGG